MTPYYDDGTVTIWNADCRDVLPLLEPESVDLVVTSPPYNLGANTWDMGGGGRRKRESGIGYIGHVDAMPEAEYRAWQQDILRECFNVVAAGGSCFYNHKPRTLRGRLISPLAWLDGRVIGWTVRQEIVWDRGSTMNHEPTLFWPEDERVYWLTKGCPKRPPRPIGISTVWRLAPEQSSNPHPAPFPVSLASRCISAITQPGDLILDPFGGSGTTARAALDLGRRCILIEREEKYCEIAVSRLSQQVLPLDVA